MSERTPTPWQISDVRTTDDTAMIVGGAGFEFGLIADVTEDVDAAFIVKAANSHDALVAALKEAISQLIPFAEDGDQPAISAAIDAGRNALSSIKEPS